MCDTDYDFVYRYLMHQPFRNVTMKDDFPEFIGGAAFFKVFHALSYNGLASRFKAWSKEDHCFVWHFGINKKGADYFNEHMNSPELEENYQRLLAEKMQYFEEHKEEIMARRIKNTVSQDKKYV